MKKYFIPLLLGLLICVSAFAADYTQNHGGGTGSFSGDATTVNGGAVPASKSIVGTNASSQIIDATNILSSYIPYSLYTTAGQLVISTGSGTAGAETISANVLSLLRSADNAAVIANLGLGALSTTTPGTGVVDILQEDVDSADGIAKKSTVDAADDLKADNMSNTNVADELPGSPVHNTEYWFSAKAKAGADYYDDITASTISFSGTTISDSGNGLAAILKGMRIFVLNGSNDGEVYTAAADAAAGSVTVVETTITESAGTSITLTTGFNVHCFYKIDSYVFDRDSGGNLLISGLGTGVNFQDTTDATKELAFDVSGNTTGKTTTLAFHSTDDETINIYDSVNKDRIVSSMDGGGSAITTGIKSILNIPFNCTITDYQVISDTSTTTTVDVWKSSYSDYDGGATHPVNGDSITASAPIAITAATKHQDSTLTGWSTSLTKGDVLYFNVDANDNATKIQINLNVTKN